MGWSSKEVWTHLELKTMPFLRGPTHLLIIRACTEIRILTWLNSRETIKCVTLNRSQTTLTHSSPLLRGAGWGGTLNSSKRSLLQVVTTAWGKERLKRRRLRPQLKSWKFNVCLQFKNSLRIKSRFAAPRLKLTWPKSPKEVKTSHVKKLSFCICLTPDGLLATSLIKILKSIWKKPISNSRKILSSLKSCKMTTHKNALSCIILCKNWKSSSTIWKLANLQSARSFKKSTSQYFIFANIQLLTHSCWLEISSIEL